MRVCPSGWARQALSQSKLYIRKCALFRARSRNLHFEIDITINLYIQYEMYRCMYIFTHILALKLSEQLAPDFEVWANSSVYADTPFIVIY